MPLLKQWESEGADFAVWKVEESNAVLRAMLQGSLPYDTELASLKAESRRTEYLAVRVLLAHVCGTEKEICHEPSGKPFISDRSFRLSISHTKGYVAVALHPKQEVGIDIERFAARVLKVADRFMGTEELQACAGRSGSGSLYYHLLHWSAKETVYKLRGEEVADFREHIRILPFSLAEEGMLVACGCGDAWQTGFRVHYFIHPDFVCTWAVFPQGSVEV